MTRIALVAAVIGLSGCATAPAVDVRTVMVDRPVAVACVKRADVPAEPAMTGKLPDDARVAADLLGATLTDVRLWGRRLAALLSGCAD